MSKKFLNDEIGATAVEYSLIVALIAFGLIVLVKHIEETGIGNLEEIEKYVLVGFGGIAALATIYWGWAWLNRRTEKSRVKKADQKMSDKLDEVATTKRQLEALTQANPSHLQSNEKSEFASGNSEVCTILGDIWERYKHEVDEAKHRFPEIETSMRDRIKMQKFSSLELEDTMANGNFEDIKELIKRCRQFFMIDNLVWSENLLPKTEKSHYLDILNETQSLFEKGAPLYEERTAIRRPRMRAKRKFERAIIKAKTSDSEEFRLEVAKLRGLRDSLMERTAAIKIELAPIDSKINALDKERERLQKSILESLIPYESVPDTPSSDMPF